MSIEPRRRTPGQSIQTPEGHPTSWCLSRKWLDAMGGGDRFEQSWANVLLLDVARYLARICGFGIRELVAAPADCIQRIAWITQASGVIHHIIHQLAAPFAQNAFRIISAISPTAHPFISLVGCKLVVALHQNPDARRRSSQPSD